METRNMEWIKSVKEQWDNITDRNITGYKVNGTMSVPIANGNSHYQDVLEWLKTNTPEPQYTDEEIAEKLLKQYISDMIKVIEDHVQEQVYKYNQENGVLFKNVDSCAKYITVDDYEHVEFCRNIITFNANVWMKAREIQGQVLAGEIDRPTVNELKTMLPVYE